MLTIESIEIEHDEFGFLLVLALNEETDLRLRLPLELAEPLLQSVVTEIQPWIMERDDAWRTFRCRPDESAGLAEDGYELSDPKHPRYHSVHVAHYDDREKV